MAKDDKKTKTAAPKKEPVTEAKAADAAPKVEETKVEAVKPGAAPPKQSMGEGQKLVTQAYKDNWNTIFARKKKR